MGQKEGLEDLIDLFAPSTLVLAGLEPDIRPTILQNHDAERLQKATEAANST